MQHLDHVARDHSAARRVLVAGDVHGHLSLLTRELDLLGYDADAGDRLILLGDLLDRGDDVLEIADWLDANPTVESLLGNHEDMLIGTLDADRRNNDANALNLLRNGGQWLLRFAPGYDPNVKEDFGRLMGDLLSTDEPWALVDPRIVLLMERMKASPTAMTVATPGGREIGLVHADVPTGHWGAMRDALESPKQSTREAMRRRCIWMRDRFDMLKQYDRYGRIDEFDCTVEDIGHVFFGHSITKEPVIHHNCSWIDTGSYKHAKITVVDADAWLDARGR